MQNQPDGAPVRQQRCSTHCRRRCHWFRQRPCFHPPQTQTAQLAPHRPWRRLQRPPGRPPTAIQNRNTPLAAARAHALQQTCPSASTGEREGVIICDSHIKAYLPPSCVLSFVFRKDLTSGARRLGRPKTWQITVSEPLETVAFVRTKVDQGRLWLHTGRESGRELGGFGDCLF